MSEVDNSKMTKGERAELAQLCRKRERVQKTAVEEHAKKLLADFEQQIATTYHLSNAFPVLKGGAFRQLEANVLAQK